MKNLFQTAALILFVVFSACDAGKNWNDTKTENSVSAYEAFLSNNPKTAHKDSIMLLIKELDWQYAKNSNSIAALDSFLIKHPEEKAYQDSIAELKENLYYKEALTENTVEAYTGFLEAYPNSSSNNEIKDKIERLKWEQVKKTNNKAGYIDFLVNTATKNYMDSIDVKFELKDFVGYAVSFFGKRKIDQDVISVVFIFNFNPGGKLSGFYDGSSEGDYNVAWGGEIRGSFDDNDVFDLEKRMTDFSDVEEFNAEDWSKFKLDFNKNTMSFISENTSYKIVKIGKIKK